MRKLFQNVAFFYGTVVIVALALQVFFAATYDDDIQAADKKASEPVELIQKHYTSPNGVPSTAITNDLGDLMNRIQTGYDKLAEQVLFPIRPEYRIDPKENYPGVVYTDRVKKWKEKNAARLKLIPGKVSYNFDVKSGFDQQSAAKLNDLLLQATVVEELLIRLEKAGVLSSIESLSTQPPRTEAFSGALKVVKSVTRVQVDVKLSGTPETLDRLLGGIRAGKGQFFVREMKLEHGPDPQAWGERMACDVGLEAITVEVEKNVDFRPVVPKWAQSAGVGR